MKLEKIQQLVKTAQSLGWAIKVKTNMGTNLILNPELGEIQIVTAGEQSFIKLKRSLLDIEDITHAYLYSTEEEF